MAHGSIDNTVQKRYNVEYGIGTGPSRQRQALSGEVKTMQIDISPGDFRRLLDLVFVGNIVLGFPRPDAPDSLEYDRITRELFSYCPLIGLGKLTHFVNNELYPSDTYMDSGIMNRLLDYEDATLYDILAEELARRDLDGQDVDGEKSEELQGRIGEYLDEFARSGLDNVYAEGV